MKSKFFTDRQEGVALVVSLLVMLALVLLALSLLLQSSTEQLVAINEEDATRALGYAETGLELVNRIVKDFSSQFPAPSNLTELLQGPDATSGTADDYLPDLVLSGFRTTLDTTKDEGDFDSSNEQTLVGMSTFFPGYAVFRVGEDLDDDGNWDGPRGLVYVKYEDNYDDGTPNTTDNDFRMRLHVLAGYPIWVDSNAEETGSNIKQRGIAVRKLLGRFEPAGRTAIRTDGDLNVGGSLEVCGECGGVHANQDLSVGGELHICTQATGTEGSTVTAGTVDVRGGTGITGEVYIPVINPYDSRYVPDPSIFFTADTDALPDWLECPGPDVTDNNNYLSLDPGASKYFAFVLRKQAGAGILKIYKAYWDPANSRWVWRLIDDNSDSVLDVTLDNCGRAVSGGYITTPDPIPAAGATDTNGDLYWGASGRPAWTGVGVSDGNNTEFYNSKNSNGAPGNYEVRTPACTADETLAGTNSNDFGATNWARIPDGSDPWDDEAGDDDISDAGDYTNPDPSTTQDPILPGTESSRNWTNWITGFNPTTDSQRDFIYEDAMEEGRNEINLCSGGQDIYSPLWGSVIFAYGNVFANGGDVLHYVNSTPAQAQLTIGIGTPPERWRISLISFGSIDVAGNPVWSSADANFGITFVAGRDIELTGTGGGGHGDQDQCPSDFDTNTGGDCTAVPTNPAGFSGMVLMHEEMFSNGNVTLDGFIIAEDAAQCSDVQSGGTLAQGSVQVHYDCDNPPDPWGNRSVQLAAWEEVQQ